jgi:hypothetical protein
MTSSGRTAVALAVGLAMTTGCSDDHSGLPSPSGVTNLVISGPASIPPRATRQFAALLRDSDGSSRDVTGQAVWRSSDDAIVSVSTAGLATGLAPGEVALTAAFDGRTAVRAGIMVLPDGTFRLMGVVRDEGFPVGGARIAVEGGSTAAVTATAHEGTGQYHVYGVAGTVRVTAAKDGFEPATKILLVNSHQNLDFDLASVGPRQSVDGAWQLTITAADACIALPQDVRMRKYTAILTQSGASIAGTLEGADFFADSGGRLNQFSGVAQPDGVRFRFAPPFDYIFYLPPVFEVLRSSPPTYFAIIGDVVATPTGDGYAGALDGSLQIWSGFMRSTTCLARNHGFVLSR